MFIKPQLSFFEFVKKNSWFEDLSQWKNVSLDTKEIYNYKLLSNGINLHQMVFAYYLLEKEKNDNNMKYSGKYKKLHKDNPELIQLITNLSLPDEQRKIGNSAMIALAYKLFFQKIKDVSVTSWDVVDYNKAKNSSCHKMMFEVLPLVFYSLARKRVYPAAGHLLQLLSIMTLPKKSIDNSKENYMTGDSLIIKCVKNHSFKNMEFFKKTLILGRCAENYFDKINEKTKYDNFYSDTFENVYTFFNSSLSRFFVNEHFEEDSSFNSQFDNEKVSAIEIYDLNSVMVEYESYYKKLFDLDVWSLETKTMDNVLALKNTYPWFGNIIDQIVLDLSASNKINNMLLVGMPGCGKTSFCHNLAKAMDIGYEFISVAGASDNRNLLGTSAGFGSAMPAMPTRAIIHNKIINPMVIIDEIDKVSESSHNGNVHDAISQFIEPSSAHRFYDECLTNKVDISQINWMFTANRVDDLPSFMKSRFNIVGVNKPSFEYLDMIVETLTKDWVSTRNIGDYESEFNNTSLICQKIKKNRRDFDIDIREVSREVNQVMSNIFQSKKESIIERQREKMQAKPKSIYKSKV